MSRQESFSRAYAALAPLQKAADTVYDLLSECITTDDDGEIVVDQPRLQADAPEALESCRKLSDLDDAQIEELCTRVSSALFGGAAEPPNLRDTMEQSRQEAGTISTEVQRDLEGEIVFKWRSPLEALRLCRTTMATFCEALKSKVDARFLATTEQDGTS